jgi:Holliday junction resolvase RusA-like endonuclease
MSHAHHLLESWVNDERPTVECELFDLFVDIRPMGKQRTDGYNHSTPEKTREWERLVGNVVTATREGRPAIRFPVAALVLWGLHNNRADIDNLEKILWDALQPHVIADDRFVRGYVEKAERQVEAGQEFVWVRFYARRLEDYTNYMEQCDAVRPMDSGY